MSKPPKHHNAADPDQVAKGKDDERARLAQETADWRGLAASHGGMRILAQLMAPALVPSYDTHSNLMSFREGQRHYALWVRSKLLEHAPEALVLIQAAEVEQLQQARIPKNA